ncbi:MAG: excinuclease ABC subunit UvrC [Erysipelotrichaceae bacterium]
MANMDKIADKLKLLPAKPGCYIMKDINDKIIYVGKAKILKNRVKSYFVGAHNYKTTKLVANIEDFEYIVTNSEKEALLLEINLIKEHDPKYNIMFKDDRTYPYLKLSNDEAPKLSVVRHTRIKNATYFGPFPEAQAAYSTLHLLNELYPLRQCNKMGNKLCLYYHIHQCLGPCVNKIDKSIYDEMIIAIKNFLKGDVKLLLQELIIKRDKASEIMNYELANDIQKQILAIEHVTSKQQIDFKDHKDRDVFNYYSDKGYISIQGFFIRGGKMLDRTLTLEPIYEDEEEAFTSYIIQYYNSKPLPDELLLPLNINVDSLKEVLDVKLIQPIKGDKLKLVNMVLNNAKTTHINKFLLVDAKAKEKEVAMNELSNILHRTIHNIELFDNSHLAGTNNVSGMVVYKDGIPSRKDYRLFKLDGYISDLDSMKEVVYRRYYRLLIESKPMCDLLLVDGGILQINAATSVLDALGIDLLVCGLVKDNHHKTSNLIDRNGTIYDISNTSPLFFLLSNMQEEVHRFAITYHRKLRSKTMQKSILDDIEGLGPKRKKLIWQTYQTLDKLKEATIDELSTIIPIAVATKLYNILHMNLNQNK